MYWYLQTSEIFVILVYWMTPTLELFPCNFFHMKNYYLHKITEWNVDLTLNLFLNIENFVVYGKWNWIFHAFSLIFIALLWEKKVPLFTNYAPIHQKYCFYLMNIWCISGCWFQYQASRHKEYRLLPSILAASRLCGHHHPSSLSTASCRGTRYITNLSALMKVTANKFIGDPMGNPESVLKLHNRFHDFFVFWICFHCHADQ